VVHTATRVLLCGVYNEICAALRQVPKQWWSVPVACLVLSSVCCYCGVVVVGKYILYMFLDPCLCFTWTTLIEWLRRDGHRQRGIIKPAEWSVKGRPGRRLSIHKWNTLIQTKWKNIYSEKWRLKILVLNCWYPEEFYLREISSLWLQNEEQKKEKKKSFSMYQEPFFKYPTRYNNTKLETGPLLIKMDETEARVKTFSLLL
jgi:hypothetical protein